MRGFIRGDGPASMPVTPDRERRGGMQVGSADKDKSWARTKPSFGTSSDGYSSLESSPSTESKSLSTGSGSGSSGSEKDALSTSVLSTGRSVVSALTNASAEKPPLSSASKSAQKSTTSMAAGGGIACGCAPHSTQNKLDESASLSESAIRAHLAGSPSMKSPAKESPAKESPAKEAPPESPTKESPAKESPAKESPAKESPTKESPTKESPAKESPAKGIVSAMNTPVSKLTPRGAPDTINSTDTLDQLERSIELRTRRIDGMRRHLDSLHDREERLEELKEKQELKSKLIAIEKDLSLQISSQQLYRDLSASQIKRLVQAGALSQKLVPPDEDISETNKDIHENSPLAALRASGDNSMVDAADGDGEDWRLRQLSTEERERVKLLSKVLATEDPQEQEVAREEAFEDSWGSHDSVEASLII